MLGVDHGAQLGLGIIGAADLQSHGLFLQQGHELVSDALLHHDDGQSHAAHAGAAVSRVDDGVDGALQIAVLQNQSVVLGLALSLNALAVSGGHGVDVLADLGGADEGDGLHAGIGQEQLGLLTGAGDQVHNALGEAALGVEQLHDAHGGQGGVGGGLQHHGVTGGDGQRHHPAPGDHGREVEGHDAGHNAQRHAVGSGIKAGGHLQGGGTLADEGGGAGQLGGLDGLEHVAAGLGQVLAQLLGTQNGQLVQVIHQDVAPLEHHLGALAQRGLGPLGKGGVSGGDGLLHFVHGAAGDFGDDFAGGGVSDFHPLVGLGVFPLTVYTVLFTFDRHNNAPLLV